MNEYKVEKKPLTKKEYLQTLSGNLVTSDDLNKMYNNYLMGFYGYN